MPYRFEEFLPLGEKGQEFLFFNNPRAVGVGKDELIGKLRVDEIQIERIAGQLNAFKELSYLVVRFHGGSPKPSFGILLYHMPCV